METASRPNSDPLALALCAGCLVVAAFLVSACIPGSPSWVAVPQPDTLIHMQCARAIAEGHPYRYTADALPSTGGTSHLYPLVLALFCRMGAAGDALVVAGFVLNALLYLGIIALAGAVAKRVVPSAWGVVLLLVVSCGQIAYTALGQTDMGLFTFLAVATLAALLYERYGWAAVSLALAVWCRPEGFILAAALLVVGLVFLNRRGTAQRLTLLGLFGCINIAAVLTLNLLLTGRLMFMSLVGKSYFAQYPFPGALERAYLDLGALIREFVFGLANSGRQFYMLPVAAGIVFLCGAAVRLLRFRERIFPVEVWWIASVLAGFALTAAGGWQGYYLDRHLGWVVPIWFVFIVTGLEDEHFRGLGGARLIGGFFAVYQVLTLPFFLADYTDACRIMTSQSNFVRRFHAAAPKEQRVGVTLLNNHAWNMPGRSFTHVGSYVSPKFVGREDPLMNLEMLKHWPDRRFDVWLLMTSDASSPGVHYALGPMLAAERMSFPSSSALGFHRADWSTLDAAVEPVSATERRAVAKRRMLDHVDVGYFSDENAHAYRVYGVPFDTKLLPFVVSATVEGKRITEVGRLVPGSSYFTVSAVPGRAARLVLRLANNVPVPVRQHGQEVVERVRLNPLIYLGVSVDGTQLGVFPVKMTEAPGSITEFGIEIPADLITHNRPEIGVVGDHLALAHWFYQ